VGEVGKDEAWIKRDGGLHGSVGLPAVLVETDRDKMQKPDGYRVPKA
jgi:hypothetical protein